MNGLVREDKHKKKKLFMGRATKVGGRGGGVNPLNLRGPTTKKHFFCMSVLVVSLHLKIIPVINIIDQQICKYESYVLN